MSTIKKATIADLIPDSNKLDFIKDKDGNKALIYHPNNYNTNDNKII